MAAPAKPERQIEPRDQLRRLVAEHHVTGCRMKLSEIPVRGSQAIVDVKVLAIRPDPVFGDPKQAPAHVSEPGADLLRQLVGRVPTLLEYDPNRERIGSGRVSFLPAPRGPGQID